MKIHFIIIFLFQINLILNHNFHSIRVIDNSTKRGNIFHFIIKKKRNSNGNIKNHDIRRISNRFKPKIKKDSNGYLAFHEPGLMNKDLWFYVSSPGYKHSEILGMEGKTINTKVGEETVLFMKRENLAERIYRTSGYGIYKDSYLLNKEIPIKEPILNTNVFGLDSTFIKIIDGKVYFFYLKKIMNEKGIFFLFKKK
jgi:hypothetical protein